MNRYAAYRDAAVEVAKLALGVSEGDYNLGHLENAMRDLRRMAATERREAERRTRRERAGR